MSKPADRQNAFHWALQRYINGQEGPRRDILRMLWREKARSVQAAELVLCYEALSTIRRPECGASLRPCIPLYAGGNVHVHRMMAYLARHLADDLYGAYVHGSLGSYEEIPYSDFDALVILDDEVLHDAKRLARVAWHLQRAQSYMFAYDPLQHHGWFVLTTFDLAYYCDAYFPYELFLHAKALLPERGAQLTIMPRDGRRESEEAFHGLATSVLRQVETRPRRHNLYTLKSLLSRFMLLPALYVQVRDGRGVWKADSFALARADFPPEVWASMEAASSIRVCWRFDPSTLQRWVLACPSFWGQRLRKRMSPPVPARLGPALDEAFFTGVARLVRSMQQRLQEEQRLRYVS